MTNWTPDEWRVFCSLLEECWPGEFSDNARRAWRVMLDPYTPAECLQALRELAAQGGRFRPAVSELVAVLRRDPGMPTFDEAWAMLFGPGGALTKRHPIPALDRVHPVVQSFAHRQGIDRLRRLDVHCPQNGHWRRREIKDAWDAHLRVSEVREVRALVQGDREGVRRLDPLAAFTEQSTHRGELEAGK